MQKSMMLIVNPNAGKGGYKYHLAQVLEVFCGGGFTPTVYFTRRKDNGAELVHKYAENYDLVVCLGGDGTLSEIVGGMMRLDQERRRPIGYIPLGTANDVARTLGLSNKPQEAAKQIVAGKPIVYDVGEFGAGNFFTYVAAFGAFTEVSYATPQEYKQMLGHMAYMLEGIRSLSKIKDYRAIVEYDGGVIEDDFIFGGVTNSTSVAGLVRLDSSIVSLSDGMFEVLLVRKPQDMIDLREIITAVLSSDFSGPNILFLRSREVRIMFPEPVAWTRDGEDGGTHRDVYIVNRHPGVEIIV
ncbi:MAG: diacylglycerol/lipid kinase family protein [Oscillospiraceae bacterium]